MQGYVFDYRLGYVRGLPSQAGFDVIGIDDAPDGKIVTLGGYTTLDMARNGQSWAHELHKQLDGKYQILNGCTDGYSSSQILMMFIRDVILLKPKLVICLSGFYNIAYKLGFIKYRENANLIMAHPFTTPEQLEYYKKITSYFGLGNDRVFYGEENHIAASELWLRQMAEINCISEEFGIEFRVVLQPCVFSGDYERSENENKSIKDDFKITEDDLESFYLGFQNEYSKIANQSVNLDYISDASRLFNDDRDVYSNASHITERLLPKLVEVLL